MKFLISPQSLLKQSKATRNALSISNIKKPLKAVFLYSVECLIMAIQAEPRIDL